MDAIVCKGCGVGIAAEDVNLDHMVAKCRRCNAVFDISAQVTTKRARPRPFVGLPAHIRVLIEDPLGVIDTAVAGEVAHPG